LELLIIFKLKPYIKYSAIESFQQFKSPNMMKNLDELVLEKKSALIEKYPSLTEEDFNSDNGDKLLIHLEQKLGKSKEDLREIIREA